MRAPIPPGARIDDDLTYHPPPRPDRGSRRKPRCRCDAVDRPTALRSVLTSRPGAAGSSSLFLASSCWLPLHYYVARRDPHDERFAWRMFSPMRMTKCTARRSPSTSSPSSSDAKFHEAWLEIAQRGRFVVIEAMAREAVQREPRQARRRVARLHVPRPRGRALRRPRHVHVARALMAKKRSKRRGKPRAVAERTPRAKPTAPRTPRRRSAAPRSPKRCRDAPRHAGRREPDVLVRLRDDVGQARARARRVVRAARARRAAPDSRTRRATAPATSTSRSCRSSIALAPDARVVRASAQLVLAVPVRARRVRRRDARRPADRDRDLRLALLRQPPRLVPAPLPRLAHPAARVLRAVAAAGRRDAGDAASARGRCA